MVLSMVSMLFFQMRGFCAVKNCENRVSATKTNVVYHKFPGAGPRANLWIEFCGHGESWTPGPNQAICSEHFHSSSYNIRVTLRRQLHTNGKYSYKIVVYRLISGPEHPIGIYYRYHLLLRKLLCRSKYPEYWAIEPAYIQKLLLIDRGSVSNVGLWI